MIAIVAGLTGCDSFGPERIVVLPISELTAPATIVEGTTLVAQVTVQFGGCRSFERIETTRATGKLTFRAIGRDGSGPNVNCPDDIRTQTVELRTDGPFTDPFVVVGVQPSGDEIRRTVRLVSR